MKFLNILTLSLLLTPLLTAENVNTETRFIPNELEKKNIEELGLIDTLSLKGGPSYAITSQTDDNGGVAGVNELEDSGVEISLRAVFNNGYIPYFKPYVDFTSILYDDRNFYIPSIGLRHDFELEDRWIEPYMSFGIGYGIMDRTESPVNNTVSFDDQTSSANFTLEGGVDFYITKHIALDLSLRYDTYNLKTTVGGNFQLSTIKDTSSVALMAGLVYRFGNNNANKDDDLDGVKNLKDYCPHTPSGASVDGYGCAQDEDSDGVIDLYDNCPNTILGAPVDDKGCALDSDEDGAIDLIDQCPNTLMGVPVNEAGCPPYKFDFSLSYKFNKYKIKHLLQNPRFSILDFLKKHEAYKVRITGYADNRGDDKANNKISRKRATNARLYLITNGIKKDRIQVLSRGKHEGLVDNRSVLNREKNRRIFVELYKNNMKIIIATKKEK